MPSRTEQPPLKGPYLEAIPASRPIDLVVSNPPYIPSEIDGLAPEVAMHEPRMALDGGPDGLDCYRELIRQAVPRIRDGIIVEIGLGQEQSVADLMTSAGLIDIELHNDLTDRVRVVVGENHRLRSSIDACIMTFQRQKVPKSVKPD